MLAICCVVTTRLVFGIASLKMCIRDRGEQVPYFLYFDVDPKDIDVNIHPTKTEIKFENEQAIWQILSASVKERCV